jgi:hypothetical protein
LEPDVPIENSLLGLGAICCYLGLEVLDKVGLIRVQLYKDCLWTHLLEEVVNKGGMNRGTPLKADQDDLRLAWWVEETREGHTARNISQRVVLLFLSRLLSGLHFLCCLLGPE